MSPLARLAVLDASGGILLAAELWPEAFGELREVLTQASTIIQVLILADHDTFTSEQRAGMVRWCSRARQALKGREGREAEAARRLLGAAARLAGEPEPEQGLPC